MKLYAGNAFTGVWLAREELFPTMWRVCLEQRKSPMMPIDRARETAMIWARFKDVDSRTDLHWRTEDGRWREGGQIVPLGSE